MPGAGASSVIQQLAAYFNRFDWYKPHAWDVPLNAVEQANVNLIASMER